MNPARLKLMFAAAMLALAGYFTWSFLKGARAPGEKVYFYDLSAQKLFVAPKDAVPPIEGIDGAEKDGVRAVVFSPSGDCERDQQIAYLERYSAQLKTEFERAKANPADDFPRLSRAEAQSHTFVRRVTDKNWTPMDAEPATEIVGAWRLAGANAVICAPEN